MSPIGQNEHPWTIVNEHTVREGCRGSALSMDNLLDDESGSGPEYTTTPLPGKSGDIINPNTTNDARQYGESFGSHEVPRSGIGNAYGIFSGQVRTHENIANLGNVSNPSVPLSKSRKRRQLADPASSPSLDPKPVNPQTPKHFSKKPKAKIEDRVQRCNKRGEGKLAFNETVSGFAANENFQGDAIQSVATQDEIDIQDTQNAPEQATARPGAEHRQKKGFRNNEDTDTSSDE